MDLQDAINQRHSIRQFIQTIADHIIEVSGKGVVDRFDTTYDEFLNHETVQEQVKELY